MKNILNLAFYKSIINSDFSLLSFNSKKNLNCIKADIQINSYNRLKTLDILQLVKSCKQFIRILQFVQSQKDYEINIIVLNKQYFYLLKNYLIEFPVLGKINFYYLNNTSKKKSNSVSLDIFIGNSKLEVYKNQVKSAVTNKTFLFQIINPKIELSQVGTYKIYNDTGDFKKIVFLINLLNLVFKNKL
jgi:hypothetical protein